jgi:hypothetical protein
VAFERERDSLLGLLEDKPPAAAERAEAVLPGS